MDTEIVKFYAIPLAMGLGLSACAGLRAWIPLLIVSLLSHFELISLNEKMAFLGSIQFIWVCGFATVIELAGDKLPWLDNALDVIGSVLRPASGIILAAAVFTNSDPIVIAVAGIIGGSTALTVSAGKTAGRTVVSSLMPFHGGIGNIAISFVEDAISIFGSILGVLFPIFAILFFAVMLWVSIKVFKLSIKCGTSIWSWFFGSKQAAADAE